MRKPKTSSGNVENIKKPKESIIVILTDKNGKKIERKL